MQARGLPSLEDAAPLRQPSSIMIRATETAAGQLSGWARNLFSISRQPIPINSRETANLTKALRMLPASRWRSLEGPVM
jgi:hypothetical protein